MNFLAIEKLQPLCRLSQRGAPLRTEQKSDFLFCGCPFACWLLLNGITVAPVTFGLSVLCSLTQRWPSLLRASTRFQDYKRLRLAENKTQVGGG